MLTIKNLSRIGLLLSAWIAWFYVLTFLTQLTFTPWDGAIDWPAVGTWQRTLNDFFASDPGRLIISIPMISVSIYFTLSTLRRNPGALNRLIGLCWMFLPVLLLVWYLSVTLNNALHPYPPVMYDPNYRGFHLTIIPGITLIALCIFWLRQQSRITYFPRNKTLTHPLQ